MSTDLRIGLIGLDTSHVDGLTGILNDSCSPHHVTGARVVSAYPAGSPDFPLSIDRVEQYTALAQQRGVAIAETPEAVAETVDAVIMTSVDGRVHRSLFERIVSSGKPTFIDKPFAVTHEDARAIAETARAHGVPIMAASSLRFVDDLVAALADDEHGRIEGADFFGPMALQPTQPGLFWYGIHTVEMLYAAFGRGCLRVQSITDDRHDTVIGQWPDGRVGTIRGWRTGSHQFGGTLHRSEGSRHIQPEIGRPKHVTLADHIITFFRSGDSPVDPEETVETIRFIEAANESRTTGKSVAL